MALFRQQVSIYPSINLSIYISIYLSNYMVAYRVFDREGHGFISAAGIYLSIYQIIHLYIQLSLELYGCIFDRKANGSILAGGIYLSIHLSIYLSIIYLIT